MLPFEKIYHTLEQVIKPGLYIRIRACPEEFREELKMQENQAFNE